MLTPREEKLLTLALNAGAMEGEADNAAAMLFRSLRKRGVGLLEFQAGVGTLNGAGAPPPIVSKPDFGMCVFPWRKSEHYGKMFLDIPPSYLRWAMGWILEDPDRAVKMNRLAADIEGFLRQGEM